MPQPVTTPEDDAHWTGFEYDVGLGWVFALTEFQGDVIAGGDFWAPFSHSFKSIARWDGVSWHKVGTGFDHDGCPGLECYPVVWALTTYQDKLVAGGNFTNTIGRPLRNIAIWDGVSWQGLGYGFNDDVLSLAEYDGKLIAGGIFTEADGRPVGYIAQWDGTSWRGLGSGLNAAPRRLAVYNGDLFATGLFTIAGGVEARGIARWNGTSWASMGRWGSSSAMTVFEGNLIATVESLGVARWNGSRWTGMGGWLGTVDAYANYNDKLIAAGNWLPKPQGNFISRWDGNNWTPLGSGLNDRCWAVVVHGGSLYAGGVFTAAGNKPAYHMARWDDIITDVEVENVQVTTVAGGIRLGWEMSRRSLDGVRAVRILRASAAEGPLVELPGSPLAPLPVMSYTDGDVPSAARRWYSLGIVHTNGAETKVGPFAADGSAEAAFHLDPTMDLQAGSPIRIRYALPLANTPTTLSIFDARGRLVRNLSHARQEAGEHIRFWDRQDEEGRAVPRGVYLVHLAAGGATATQKLVLLHR